jgi:hypothetical protein
VGNSGGETANGRTGDTAWCSVDLVARSGPSGQSGRSNGQRSPVCHVHLVRCRPLAVSDELLLVQIAAGTRLKLVRNNK